MRALVLVACLIPALSGVVAPARAASATTDDPDAVVKEITTLIADGDGQGAGEAVTKYINAPQGDTTQTLKLQNVLAALKLLTQNGKAYSVDEVWRQDFGASVKLRIEYVNFPLSANPTNQFGFFRYTFMKLASGWAMTDFTFATTSQFPPAGWALVSAPK